MLRIYALFATLLITHSTSPFLSKTDTELQNPKPTDFALFSRLIGIAALAAPILPAHTYRATSTPTGVYFPLVEPGSHLPGDAECAAAVKPRPENKRVNVPFNSTRGNGRLAANFFTGDDARANTEIASRVTGNFTGTTDEIIQWVACKWGIDEDIVRAQTAVESGWRQTTVSDWYTKPERCPPGHPLGGDGRMGLCPQSWGAMQVKYHFYSSGWPETVRSTAFNLDTAYAVWRACFEGYEKWLNDVSHVGQYVAGDVWGCVGRWYAGRWHTPAAANYITRVKSFLAARVWEYQQFQQP